MGGKRREVQTVMKDRVGGGSCIRLNVWSSKERNWKNLMNYERRLEAEGNGKGVYTEWKEREEKRRIRRRMRWKFMKNNDRRLPEEDALADLRLHISSRAGTTTQCHSRLYPPVRDYEFSYRADWVLYVGFKCFSTHFYTEKREGWECRVRTKRVWDFLREIRVRWWRMREEVVG